MFPWSRVHDFLLEVGDARTQNEFNRRVFDGVQRLIPYDIAAGFFDMSSLEFLAGKGLPDSANKIYNQYFRLNVPWKTPRGLIKVYTTWRVDLPAG